MAKIPIIDFSKFNENGSAESLKELGEEIREACHGIGFMYLVNHGIPEEKIQRLYNESVEFFELSQERKEQFPAGAENNFRGYTRPGGELLNPESGFEFRETFTMIGLESPQPFPEELPAFKEAMFDVWSECRDVSVKLLHLFGIALDLPDKELFVKSNRGLTDKSVSSCVAFRSNYYPAIPESTVIPPNSTRIAAHSDYGVLTMLFQDAIGGLEVKTPEGTWIPATPIPNSVVINLGEMMELWTGGYFKATAHRVLVPEEEIRLRRPRQSIAFFVQADDDFIISPLKSNCNYDFGGNFKPMRFGEYFYKRLGNTYEQGSRN